VRWFAAEVVATRAETPYAAVLTLRSDRWEGHRPGQHVDARLRAADGYVAARSYSVASAPATRIFEILVERIKDGEVSPYLADELQVGSQLEVSGPFGGYFVWEAATWEPVLLVGGGSGVVPLLSMLRHHAATGSHGPVTLLYSARTIDHVLCRDELQALSAGALTRRVEFTLSREQPLGWTGYGRRIDAPMLDEVGWAATSEPLIFVCGPTGFVEATADALVALGHAGERVRTERFGPSSPQ
jgi:ferredoxin-NADP reductase